MQLLPVLPSVAMSMIESPMQTAGLKGRGCACVTAQKGSVGVNLPAVAVMSDIAVSLTVRAQLPVGTLPCAHRHDPCWQCTTELKDKE